MELRRNAMGSPVGVFNNKEVKGLSKRDIALLKAHVLDQIQTSAASAAYLTETENSLGASPEIGASIRY
jgi:hypothetical protein